MRNEGFEVAVTRHLPCDNYAVYRTLLELVSREPNKAIIFIFIDILWQYRRF